MVNEEQQIEKHKQKETSKKKETMVLKYSTILTVLGSARLASVLVTTSRPDMGSTGMFDGFYCRRCCARFPPVYHTSVLHEFSDLCSSCARALVLGQVQYGIFAKSAVLDQESLGRRYSQDSLGILLAEEILMKKFIGKVTDFLVPDYKNASRLFFLRNALTAWRVEKSPFLQFTYFHNGRAGNVSEVEDILDRILDFLNRNRSPAFAQDIYRLRCGL